MKSTPPGFALFYETPVSIERVPFAEERAILGGMPQAGFVPKEVGHVPVGN